MNQRTALLNAVREAHQSGDGSRVATAVAALAAHDRITQAQAAQTRELDYGQQLVDRRFAMGPMHGDRHSWQTDFLGDESPRLDYRVAMRAEAATWVRSLHPMVLADHEELTQQALGRARTAASSYGEDFQGAYSEFLAGVGRALGASGLPQIDQVVDPNNQPSPTPYPTQVFDNFAPEQNDYNGGVESPNRSSAISSESAPFLQQVNQMNSGGSGFGSGPEVEDHHDTAFNPGLGYAEVPLGQPGTIPSAGPGQGTPVGQSAPTPLPGPSGQPLDSDGDYDGDQDEDDERRKTGSLYYSVPDPHGFRWMASQGADIYHPYHERCASSHWPDEDCSSAIAHTASVAIGYSMNLEQAHRVAQCERIGAQEGLRALAACRGSLQQLAGHHNRVAAGWGKSARTMEDTAVLHGFQAVVRPVLADATQGCSKCRLGASVIVDGHRFCGEHGRQYREAQHKKLQPYEGRATSGKCANCQKGDCAHCTGNCDCTHPKQGTRRTAAGGLAGGGGVTESERENATHHLPGTDKFPVNGPADVENAKHDIGRTNEPHDKVVRYINEMAREYHVAPVGGSKAASLMQKAARKIQAVQGGGFVIVAKSGVRGFRSLDEAQLAFARTEFARMASRLDFQRG